jgi:hypothetical protein
MYISVKETVRHSACYGYPHMTPVNYDHLTRQMDSCDLLYNHHALFVVAVYHYITVVPCFSSCTHSFMTTTITILQNILIDV